MTDTRIERTEEGARSGLEENSKYKGIARHPLARKWILRQISRAIESGDPQAVDRAGLRAKRYGML